MTTPINYTFNTNPFEMNPFEMNPFSLQQGLWNQRESTQPSMLDEVLKWQMSKGQQQQQNNGPDLVGLYREMNKPSARLGMGGGEITEANPQGHAGGNPFSNGFFKTPAQRASREADYWGVSPEQTFTGRQNQHMQQIAALSPMQRAAGAWPERGQSQVTETNAFEKTMNNPMNIRQGVGTAPTGPQGTAITDLVKPGTPEALGRIPGTPGTPGYASARVDPKLTAQRQAQEQLQYAAIMDQLMQGVGQPGLPQPRKLDWKELMKPAPAFPAMS